MVAKIRIGRIFDQCEHTLGLFTLVLMVFTPFVAGNLHWWNWHMTGLLALAMLDCASLVLFLLRFANSERWSWPRFLLTFLHTTIPLVIVSGPLLWAWASGGPESIPVRGYWNSHSSLLILELAAIPRLLRLFVLVHPLFASGGQHRADSRRAMIELLAATVFLCLAAAAAWGILEPGYRREIISQRREQTRLLADSDPAQAAVLARGMSGLLRIERSGRLLFETELARSETPGLAEWYQEGGSIVWFSQTPWLKVHSLLNLFLILAYVLMLLLRRATALRTSYTPPADDTPRPGGQLTDQQREPVGAAEIHGILGR